jgi:hypothetical protein
MTWQVHIPFRSRDESLDARTIWELPKLLDSDEDARVTRELFAIVRVSGAKTVGQVVDLVESLDATDRRLYLDACRKSAGFRTATEIDNRAAYERANAAGRVRGNPLLQRCHHPDCDRVPLTSIGSLAETKARRWHWAEHAHLAEPGDLEDRPPPWRYSPSGAIVDAEGEAEAARAAAQAETRRRFLEEQAAERKVEAEERRQHQQAIADEVRRLVPPGVPS